MILRVNKMPISAVYKKGVIKPLAKVNLKENEQIEIEIRRKKEPIVKTKINVPESIVLELAEKDLEELI